MVLIQVDGLVTVSVGSTAREQDATRERLGQTVGTRDDQLHFLEVAQSLHVFVFANHLRTPDNSSKKILANLIHDGVQGRRVIAYYWRK